MKYLFFILLPFAAAFTTFAADQANDVKDIQGAWVPIKAEMAGQLLTNDFLKATVLKLDNGKYEVTVEEGKGGAADAGSYTIDATLKPKTIDIVGNAGTNGVKKIPGIYELRGNKLQICYGLGGSARPTEFKSAPGTKYFLVTYQRKKSKS